MLSGAALPALVSVVSLSHDLYLSMEELFGQVGLWDRLTIKRKAGRFDNEPGAIETEFC